jgi:uncharacterized protein YceK
MRRIALFITAAVLAGCAASVVSTSPRSVMINAGTRQAQDAQNLATVECAKQGLHARMSSGPGFGNPRQWTFDCVP